jgi:hypothetical protein
MSVDLVTLRDHPKGSLDEAVAMGHVYVVGGSRSKIEAIPSMSAHLVSADHDMGSIMDRVSQDAHERWRMPNGNSVKLHATILKADTEVPDPAYMEKRLKNLPRSASVASLSSKIPSFAPLENNMGLTVMGMVRNTGLSDGVVLTPNYMMEKFEQDGAIAQPTTGGVIVMYPEQSLSGWVSQWIVVLLIALIFIIMIVVFIVNSSKRKPEPESRRSRRRRRMGGAERMQYSDDSFSSSS